MARAYAVAFNLVPRLPPPTTRQHIRHTYQEGFSYSLPPTDTYLAGFLFSRAPSRFAPVHYRTPLAGAPSLRILFPPYA